MVRQPAREEIDDLQRRIIDGHLVWPAVPIEDLALVRDPLNPELRDAAVADLPLRAVGMLGKTRASKRWPQSVSQTQVPLPAARRVVFVISRSKPKSRSSFVSAMVGPLR